MSAECIYDPHGSSFRRRAIAVCADYIIGFYSWPLLFSQLQQQGVRSIATGDVVIRWPQSGLDGQAEWTERRVTSFLPLLHDIAKNASGLRPEDMETESSSVD